RPERRGGEQGGNRPDHGLRDLDQRAVRQLPWRRRPGDRHRHRLDRLRPVLRRPDRRAGSRRMGARAHLPAHPERPADRGARRQPDSGAPLRPPRSACPGHLRRHRHGRSRTQRSAVRGERRRPDHPSAPAGLRLLPAAALQAALGPRRPRQRRLARRPDGMLTHLKLRDLVIVDEAELEFGPGLTALTGETGAGKSIVVDALLLVAGSRGAGDVVRHGAERAEVAASFAGLCAGALRWHEGEVLVRRVIGADGRSRAYINGQMVPIQALREFSDMLIEIHGQQEFQHLVKRSAQRDLLDERLGDPQLSAPVAQVYERYRACRREHESLKSAAESRDARLDLLRYQLTEFKAEVTTVAAIEELFAEQKRIAGHGRLAAAAGGALAAVYEDDGANAHDLLAKAAAALRSAAEMDPKLGQAAQLVSEAGINAREAAAALRHYLDALDVDPQRQEQIERHAAALEALARKHRQSVLELPAQLARTEQEIQVLANAGLGLSKLEAALEELTCEYGAAALRLTQARRRAAEELGGQITELMQVLGMRGGRFAVNVESSAEQFGPGGR